MPLWMKKLFVIVVLGGGMVMMTGGFTSNEVAENMANQAQAATVNPLYQLACPADAGVIPSWLCTQLTQENNNNSALRSAINTITAQNLKGRVVDGGPIVLDDAGGDGGLDSSYTGYYSFSPSATATRILTGYNSLYYAYTLTGTFTGTEVLRCRGKTNFSDSTSQETDGSTLDPDWTADGGTTASGIAAAAGVMLPPTYIKNGVYASSLSIKCMTDAGASNVGVTFTLYGQEI